MTDGTVSHVYRLENEHLQVDVSDYGCRVVSLIFKDPLTRAQQQCVLGQWTLSDYEQDTSYMGAIVGRTCNRIDSARFELEGERFNLDANEGLHHLHGGYSGFHNRCWRTTFNQSEVLFQLDSPQGESGYPGNVSVWVRISLIHASLHYEFGGKTDQTTLLDMTNHAYFCLDHSGDIRAHELKINANQFAPINAEFIPTGELRAVEGTPFDFRQERHLGEDLISVDRQTTLARGYDHAFLLNPQAPYAATLYSAQSDIEMKLQTNSPALQFYSGNSLSKAWSALCLEPQHLPNACNQAGFAAPVCAPDKPFQSQISYHFKRRG